MLVLIYQAAMCEPQFYECSARSFTPETFTSGDLDFNFYVGPSDSWHPSKSYLRVGMTVLGSGAAQPTASQMVALADNAVGNLFINASLRAGEGEISKCLAGLPQASALVARTKPNPWLKSLAQGTGLNEPQFSKRVMSVASDSAGDAYLGAENEMYKPVDALHFSDATVDISALQGTNNAGSVAFPLVQNGGLVNGVDTLFQTGMPTDAGAPTGGSVAVGDVLVVRGVSYSISAVDSETELKVSAPSSVSAGAPTTDWYIIRKDQIRAPQSSNTVYAIWRPPLGIFDYAEGLGSGNFKLSLSPNPNYSVAAIETKNNDYVAGTSFNLRVSSIKLYTYQEKLRIPDQIMELPLMEYQVLSKPWQSTLQFSVSPDTQAITIFIQDRLAGWSALIPPSMFKTIDNSDLKLGKIQVSYANINRPPTPFDSDFGSHINEMQQRYRDTYHELGLDTSALGCETYSDYLQRGPMYHYCFVRDRESRATEVSVSTTFNGLPSGPSGGTALVYCIAHFKSSVRLTTAEGRIVASQMLRG